VAKQGNYEIHLYTTSDGICPVLDFMQTLSKRDKAKFVVRLEYLQDVGINARRPLADLLRNGIHELRIKLSGDNTRTLYFFCFEKHIVLTHTFVKQGDKVPDAQIERAIKYKKDFIKRYVEEQSNVKLSEIEQYNNRKS
jgi:phage-related protein